VRGYGALETGLYTLPIAVASAIFMQISGRVFDRVGARIPVLFGMTCIGGAMWLMSRIDGATTGADLFVPMTLMGAGMGSMMMALNTHLLNVAPRELVGRVTALTSAMQNVVASLGIATFATILQARIPFHVAEASLAADGAPSPALLADAMAFAFGDVYRTALMVVAVGWCLVWSLRRPQAVAEPPIRRSDSPSATEATYEEREPVLIGH
jgi:MFS family permease